MRKAKRNARNRKTRKKKKNFPNCSYTERRLLPCTHARRTKGIDNKQQTAKKKVSETYNNFPTNPRVHTHNERKKKKKEKKPQSVFHFALRARRQPNNSLFLTFPSRLLVYSFFSVARGIVLSRRHFVVFIFFSPVPRHIAAAFSSPRGQNRNRATYLRPPPDGHYSERRPFPPLLPFLTQEDLLFESPISRGAGESY